MLELSELSSHYSLIREVHSVPESDVFFLMCSKVNFYVNFKVIQCYFQLHGS